MPVRAWHVKSCEGVNRPGGLMKDPLEVLRRKEAELERLQEEVDALRLAGQLLREKSASGQELQPRGKVLQMP